MTSIKLLLIAGIILLAYQSDFPDKFADLTAKEWVFLIGFALSFWYGVHLTMRSIINGLIKKHFKK